MPQCTHVRSAVSVVRGGQCRQRRGHRQMPPTKRPGLRLRPGSNSRLSVRMSSSAPAGTRSPRIDAGAQRHWRRARSPRCPRPRRRSRAAARSPGPAASGSLRVDRHPQQAERRARRHHHRPRRRRARSGSRPSPRVNRLVSVATLRTVLPVSASARSYARQNAGPTVSTRAPAAAAASAIAACWAAHRRGHAADEIASAAGAAGSRRRPALRRRATRVGSVAASSRRFAPPSPERPRARAASSRPVASSLG